MKKLYRKGTVHPSPTTTPTPPSFSDDNFSLSFLPAALLALAAALSTVDREVLAYLLSASSAADFDPSKPHHHHQIHRNKSINHHPPSFSCHCFSCYTSYWARWDSSPNRHLIHQIIDALEDDALLSHKKKKPNSLSRKEKRKNNNTNNKKKGLSLNEDAGQNGSGGSGRVNPEVGRPEMAEDSGGQPGNGGCDGDDEVAEEKQGPVRKIVSLIGERIWGSVWG